MNPLGNDVADPSLRADALSKSYGGRTVVRDVALEVHPGEVVGLLGPNGAGKTTTFYMLVGLARPDVGREIADDAGPGYLRRRAKQRSSANRRQAAATPPLGHRDPQRDDRTNPPPVADAIQE